MMIFYDTFISLETRMSTVFRGYPQIPDQTSEEMAEQCGSMNENTSKCRK